LISLVLYFDMNQPANPQIRWSHYSIMLLIGLSIFIVSIYAAFNYIFETSKASVVHQAYDYFVLLKAHQQIDRLTYRLQLASIEPQTAMPDKNDELNIFEQLGITWARINDLITGKNAERLRLLKGLPQFKEKIEITFEEMEFALEEKQPGYAKWAMTLQQLSKEFKEFTDSPTGLLAIQRKLQQSSSTLYQYFAAILISGFSVLFIYGFALSRTITTSKALAQANARLESEGEQLRQVKEALLEQVEALFYQASYDPLTNLANRHEFEQRLQSVLYNLRQSGEQHGLCYMDLDQFKVINDICGHVVGDKLLRKLSTQLSEQVHGQDILARLGGDEFALLVKNCSLRELEDTAENLRKTVEDFRLMWEDKAFNITASIGVVLINQNSSTLTTVLSDADAACYIAKEKGRNRIHVYESDTRIIQRRKDEMSWVSRINQAFEKKRFRLYHQLIVPTDKSSLEKKHYEVLVRMISEDGQLIPPGAFLPAAERYNLTPLLDRWIVQTLFVWFSSHPEKLAELAICAINLSGISIADKTFSEFLLQQFDHYAIPPEKICFEVTETAAISNLAEASSFMTMVKTRGCHFSLDDFGSGMSSFAYLKNLPVDYLKIDGSFVRNITTNGIDHVMVEAIHRVGHVMGLKTIAEYVEDDKTLQKLREIGVDYAQGYGIAKPMPLIV